MDERTYSKDGDVIGARGHGFLPGGGRVVGHAVRDDDEHVGDVGTITGTGCEHLSVGHAVTDTTRSELTLSLCKRFL